MTVARSCLDRCGRLAVAGRSRCAVCEAGRQRARNARPQRQALYGGGWAQESRAIRAAHPWCVVCRTSRDLTVDHPTRHVLCRVHHSEREAQRRADARASR